MYYVYLIGSAQAVGLRAEDERTPQYVKIGVTEGVMRRLSQLQVGNPERLRVIMTITCKTREQAVQIETFLHERYAKYRRSGEWFLFPRVPEENIIADIEMSVQLARMLDQATVERVRRVPENRSIAGMRRLLEYINNMIIREERDYIVVRIGREVVVEAVDALLEAEEMERIRLEDSEVLPMEHS